MSSITHADSPTNLPPSVGDKLRRLRRVLVTWITVEGLAWVALAVAGVVLVDVAIDRLFRMDQIQRQISLVLMAAAIVYVAYRKLVKPLGQKFSDDMLILQVEQRHRELGQSLISAVQFSRVEDRVEGLGMSPRLVRATIDHGVRAADGVAFSDIVEKSRFQRNLGIVGVVVAAFAVVGFWAPQAFAIWWNRNILIGHAQWPQDTHLRIVGEADGVITLPKGDDLKIEVEVAEGIVPSAVTIDYGPNRSKRGSSEMTAGPGATAGDRVAEDASQKPRYEFTFKNVLEEFSVRARGGDGQTEWVDVRLVDRPSIKVLDLQLTPPAYTALKPASLVRGQGPYEFYTGSRLRVSGMATKELKSANLRIVRRGVPATVLPMTVDAGNPQGFSVALAPDQVRAANYEIEVMDRDDRRSKRPEQFTLKNVADRVPSVGAKLDGISSMIVPGARVPLGITVSDDFAVTETIVSYRIKRTIEIPAANTDAPIGLPVQPPDPKPTDKPATDKPADKPAEDKPADAAPNGSKLSVGVAVGSALFADPPAAPAADQPAADKPAGDKPAGDPAAGDDAAPAEPPAPTVNITERAGSVPVTGAKVKFGEPHIETTYPLEAPPLKLLVGDELELVVEAKDNDTISGPKVGKSHRFQLRVVTEEELRADLLRREKDQRKQFEDLITSQDDLVTETKALSSDLAGNPATSPEVRATLLKAQKRQHQIGERCRTIGGWMEQIALEAENNRLEGPEGRYQKEVRGKVIAPLNRLVSESIPAAAQMLDEARRLPDGQAAKRDEQLDKAVAAEQQIAKEMRTILRYMVKAEGYQEAVNLAYRILDVQGGVNEATRKMLRELIEGSGDK
jgi:hypothetical protein